MAKIKKVVDSSNIHELEYDDVAGTLVITFKGRGDRYRYKGVPVEVFHDLATAPSVGRYFAANVKGAYAHELLT